MSGIVDGVLFALLTCLVVGLPGSLYFYKGYRLRQWYRRIDRTPVETPDTVRPGETALVRAPIAADRPTGAPVSGETTALAAWSLREWSSNQNTWLPKMRGIRIGDTRLEGDATAVELPSIHYETEGSSADVLGFDGSAEHGLSMTETLVETDEFDTDLEYNPEDSLPERLASFEKQLGVDPAAKISPLGIRHPDGARNYREMAVDPGETVTLLGRITAADDPGGLLSLAPPADGHMLVTRLSPDELARRYRRGYWLTIYGVGAVIVVFSALMGYAGYL